MEKKKLCFVIQRYGEEINGGAEDYTRTYAERMAEKYDITVLTTTALDYNLWENHYPEGETEINGIKVIRFPVGKTRDSRFPEMSARMYTDPSHTLSDEYEWVESQGPYCPELPRYAAAHKDDFDLFLIFTYLYYPAVMTMREVGDKAVLVPFCHDEPPVYFRCYEEEFSRPLGIVFNTEEERSFVYRRFYGADKKPSVLTGIGLDIPDIATVPDMREKFGIDGRYILYMGRIEESKGCHELFPWFLKYKKETGSDIKLVLTGKVLMDIPESDDIIPLGFVSAEEKYSALRYCDALILPSHFESLSIVVLEAFGFEKPVLVSGHCAVLRGHCVKSNAGLYFTNPIDFAECLNLLESEPTLRDAMGRNGKKYVDENYRWDAIMTRLDDFLDNIMR